MTKRTDLDAHPDPSAEFTPWEFACGPTASKETVPYLRCRAGRNEVLIPRAAARSEALLNLCQPTTLKGHALRGALSLAIMSCWQHWPMERVHLNIDPLLQLVKQVTGVANAIITFRIGTSTRHRKVIAQASLASGQIVAILKLPLTQESVARVRHEARMLAFLNASKGFAGQVPTLLHAGEFQGSFVLVQTAVNADCGTGPRQFVTVHEDYLNQLHQTCPSRRTANTLVDSVWKRCSGSRYSAEFYSALKPISDELGASAIECSLTHGDFAPWNTRVRDGRLYVFDWESATTGRPCIWDEFHFRTQAAALLKSGRFMPKPEKRALYALYLLDSLAMLEKELSPDASAMEYRRCELNSLLKRIAI
jgi:phosphotransferase family enzyme